jgi:hypothetical protein
MEACDRRRLTRSSQLVPSQVVSMAGSSAPAWPIAPTRCCKARRVSFVVAAD